MGLPELPAPAARYRDALPPGEVLDFETTSLDRTGVPVWCVTFFAESGPDAGGHGFGLTPEAAAISAFGEMTEVVRAHRALSRRPRRRAPYRELRGRLGHRAVVDPVTLALEAGSDYGPDRPLDWVETTRFRTGETVWVPAEFVATRAVDLPGSPPPGGWLTTIITNGLGAGDTLERAVGHGILELFQRDGNGLAFRALDRGVVIDTSAVTDPATRELLAHLDECGIEVLAKLASDDFGIANVVVVGWDRDDILADPLAMTACGEGASPDREHALRKALLEYCAARVRKVFTHGGLPAVEKVAPPDYLRSYLSRPAGPEEERALEGMIAWRELTPPEMRDLLADTVFSHRRTVALDTLPTVPPGSVTDPKALLDDVVGRLEDNDLDLLVADFSGEGIHAVKVIVPGLEVETMTYGRIGERGVRRLLDRGSPLAGIGAPPPGAARVHLTAEAMQRLGGPAWLDRAAVDRRVGALYPLYREPGRHTVARVLAGHDVPTAR